MRVGNGTSGTIRKVVLSYCWLNINLGLPVESEVNTKEERAEILREQDSVD